MFKRQTSGSVVCSRCGRLVGVQDERCYNCGKWNPGLWGFAPLLGRFARDLGFADVVVGGCVVLYLLSLLLAPSQIGMGGIFSLLSPGMEPLRLLGMSGAIPIFLDGRWWTVLSAAWLHGGVLHILFNMLWIRQLAPPIGHLFGISRLVIIYTVSSITGFALTSLMGGPALLEGLRHVPPELLPLPLRLLEALPLPLLPGPFQGAVFTVGASAPLFGLFGALYLYGQRSGNQMIGRQYLQFAVVWLVIGLFAGGMIRIDNWAHLGGFAGGYLTARWLDPLRPEKPEHSIAALVCLVLTVLSIVASVVHGLSGGLHPLR